ncbi:unnamed protein product [Arctogadus glacialis]
MGFALLSIRFPDPLNTSCRAEESLSGEPAARRRGDARFPVVRAGRRPASPCGDALKAEDCASAAAGCYTATAASPPQTCCELPGGTAV